MPIRFFLSVGNFQGFFFTPMPSQPLHPHGSWPLLLRLAALKGSKNMGTVTGWLGIFGAWEDVNQTYSESKWWWKMVIYHGRICKQSPTKQIQISSWESKGIYSQCDPPTLEMRPSLGNDHDDKPPFIRQLRYLSKFLSFLKPEFWGHFEG